MAGTASSRPVTGIRSGMGASRLLLAAAVVFGLAACQSLYRNHGYAPTEAELQQVVVGKDTRETVTESVGRPSAQGVLSDNEWYYVQSRYRQRGPYAPEEIDRQVVVISFNESGTVRNVERFGLEDGEVVALSRRVTEPNIKSSSFLRQLLGNIGGIGPGQFLQQSSTP